MGAEDAGADAMIDTAQAFGFNQDVPIDLPRPAGSSFPTDFENDAPKLAQSSIGQNDVRATPLQMALVAAAVANGGEIMTPHVVREVRDDQGEVVDTIATDDVWTRAMSDGTADLLRQGMISVVAGRHRQPPGRRPRGLRGRRQDGHRPDRLERQLARLDHRLRRTPRRGAQRGRRGHR